MSGEWATELTPDEALGSSPLALATLHWAVAAVEAAGPVGVRGTRSQVALRRRRGFAYV